ncbi:hypothetical protein A0H81_06084 [Grifola frondosa]|uniref:CCHC-type domain-containing protein n=1 Tax=Grifola frondosa TaxID=5627 RepID=A0A1C7M9J1_GRIFR|nr:hypothetical protein A0H81_06084 [Grifola frondosa]
MHPSTSQTCGINYLRMRMRQRRTKNGAKEVKAFYPTADANRKYTLQDLDLLIGERSRLGISTQRIWETITGSFSRSQSSFVVDRGFRQVKSRGLYKPFTPTLWQSVHSRLQLKYPDHNPDDFWPLRHILDAAHYVLHGTRVDAPAQGTPAAATTSTALPPGTIKTEDFTSLIETVTRTIAQAFATSANMAFANAQPQTSRVSNIANANPNTTSGGCHYCGEFGHVIGGCPKVQEDIDIGRIRATSRTR